jgi:phenylalanyl-tRNA synthetase alpha chain
MVLAVATRFHSSRERENMSELNALVQEAQAQIAAANDVAAIEQVRVQYLGKKSRDYRIAKSLGQMGEEERRSPGAVLNQAREAVTSAVEARKVIIWLQQLSMPKTGSRAR